MNSRPLKAFPDSPIVGNRRRSERQDEFLDDDGFGEERSDGGRGESESRGLGFDRDPHQRPNTDGEMQEGDSVPDLTDEFKVAILGILAQHKATKANPITAASLASGYNQKFKSSIKAAMNIPPTSIVRWWNLLKSIPNVGYAVQGGKEPNRPENIDVFLKNKVPKNVKQRIYDILRDVASSSQPIDSLRLIAEYKNAHGKDLAGIVATYTSVKFSKFIEQLPGVVMERSESNKPLFYLEEENAGPSQPPTKKKKVVQSENSSSSAEARAEFGGIGNDSTGFIEPQFSPISSPVPDEIDADLNELSTASYSDRGISSGVSYKQLKEIQRALSKRMEELKNNRDDALPKVRFRTFIEDNIDFLNDKIIAKILMFAESPPGTKGTPSSTPSHHSGTMYIENIVDVDLLINRFQEIEDPLTNDVAFLLFNLMKKFGQERHAQMFVSALFSRIAKAIKEASVPVAPNTIVTVRDDMQPWDITLQFFSPETLHAAFFHIQRFSQHEQFMGMIGMLGKKVAETVQYVTKPELHSTREGEHDYIYRIQNITFFPIPIYADIIHYFRSYEKYTLEMALALDAINAKVNISFVLESKGCLLSVSDLKLISKGIIKLMNAATQHSIDGNEKTAKSSNENVKLDLLRPLYTICELIAEKLSLLYERNQSCSDESLLVNILQGIKGQAVHNTSVRKLMSALAKVMTIMHADHFRDERIVDTFLQFALISLPTFQLQYPEVEEFLFAFSKLLKIVFEKFVRPHYIENGSINAQSLDQYAKVIARKAKKYPHFDPSQLRCVFSNLSAKSKAVRVFFLALRPWLNFSFCDDGFDSLEVLKTVPFDKIVSSYCGLCHLRDTLIVEDLSSLFINPTDNAKSSPTPSCASADIQDMLFNFDYIVEQTIRIPFSHCVVGHHFTGSNDGLSTDFLAQQSLIEDPSSIASFSRQFNPRVKYMALKNLGRCCLHWREDDQILQFVFKEIVKMLDVELEVAAENLPVVSDSKKRKREGQDHNPFFLLVGLYCELISNAGRGKSWRTDAGMSLLSVSHKKLYPLMYDFQRDLQSLDLHNQQLDRKNYMLLKHLSLLSLGIENVFQLEESTVGVFEILRHGAVFYTNQLMDKVSKEARLQSLSMLIMMNRGISRFPFYVPSSANTIRYDIAHVLQRQMIDLAVMMKDLDNMSDINEKQAMQETVMELFANLFQGRLFSKLMNHVVDSSSMKFTGTNFFKEFWFKYEFEHHPFMGTLMKNEDSFTYFFAVSETFRSLAVFFTRVDLCDQFETTDLLAVIGCMAEMLDGASRAFSSSDSFAVEVQKLLQRQPVRSQEDYQYLKTRLQALRPDQQSRSDNSSFEASDDGSFDGSEFGKPWQKYGESAIDTLYNMRFFIFLMTQLQCSSLCDEITNQDKYTSALESVYKILSIELFLTLMDLDQLSSKGLLRLLRVCLSILELNASLPDSQEKQNVTFRHIGMLPHLIDDVFRRSVELLQSKYVAHKQVGLGAVLKSNGSSAQLSSTNSTSSIENPMITLLTKDTLELFQECCYFVQYYFGTFPYSTTTKDENAPSIKDHFGSALMALKEIYDNFYEGMIQLPGMFPATASTTISKLPNRPRMDDVRVRLLSSMKIIEDLLVESVKNILFERNRAAWDSLTSYCVVRSFPSVVRLEYSPATIMSVANRYVDNSFYERTENGLNCVTVYHSTYGRVMIFNSDLQMIPRDPSKSLKKAVNKSRESFHHHLLMDITTDADFTNDTVFNLTLNSAKMSASFDVIFCLIILEIDSLPPLTTVSPATAVEEMSKMTLHYLGLTA